MSGTAAAPPGGGHLMCRKGFKKKRVKGRTVCKKVKNRHRRHHHRR